MTNQTIEACSLDDTQLEKRLAMIRSELLPHVTATERLTDGFVWHCRKDASLRAKLEHWIGLERDCCSRWDFSLEDKADHLSLTVTGLGKDLGRVQALAAEGASGATKAPGVGVLGAGAIGLGSALGLCCGVPMAVAAVAGASVAAPLAVLDTPAGVLGTAVVVGAGVWLFQRRRAALTDCGC